MTEFFVGVFIILGTALIGVAIIGLLRLPDLLTRAHALTKAMTLGISLLLFAFGMHHGTASAGFKALLTIFFLFLTIPVAGHLVGLVAYRQNLPRWKQKPPAMLPAKEEDGGSGV